MTTKHTHTVWLGCRASIWAHRGESHDDALAVVTGALGPLDGLVEYVGNYYGTQADCDADTDGSRALAGVAEIEEDYNDGGCEGELS